MKETLLKIDRLTKHFDGVHAVSDFSCTVQRGEVVALIGPNGAGKTTVFNIVTGLIPKDAGKISFLGEPIETTQPDSIARKGIARTFQDVRLIRRISVLSNVLLSFQDQSGEKLRNALFRNRHWRSQEQSNREKAIALLELAGIAENANDLADYLSYGQQKLLSIVCCLAAGAELILLDEPVAGIAPEMMEKVLNIIGDWPKIGKSVVLIEHNIEAIRQVSQRFIFMDAGSVVCEGSPDQVLNDPRVIEAYLD